jgi:hypothetical protein
MCRFGDTLLAFGHRQQVAGATPGAQNQRALFSIFLLNRVHLESLVTPAVD